MVEQQAQTFSSAINSAVVSLADRMRARRAPEKRARVRHNQITMAQAENAREAWLFSIRNGAPLNTFATVHWGHAPAKAEGLHPVDRNGLLRDGLKAWVYRNAPGVPFAWIEVREKTRALGEHVHLVAHCKKPGAEGESRPPTKYDIRGSSAISDQSHNIVTVWMNKAKRTELEKPAQMRDAAILEKPDHLVTIEKQRNGDFEGRFALFFDARSMRFCDSDLAPVEPYPMEAA